MTPTADRVQTYLDLTTQLMNLSLRQIAPRSERQIVEQAELAQLLASMAADPDAHRNYLESAATTLSASLHSDVPISETDQDRARIYIPMSGTYARAQRRAREPQPTD